MAIKLEMINLIVRIDKIKEKYPGGWEQFLEDYRNDFSVYSWYDEYLFREGAASPAESRYNLDKWLSMGFEGFVKLNGKNVWGDDLCIVEGLFGGVTAPCDWIEFKVEPHAMYVYLKDTEPGEIIGREQMPQYNADDWVDVVTIKDN